MIPCGFLSLSELAALFVSCSSRTRCGNPSQLLLVSNFQGNCLEMVISFMMCLVFVPVSPLTYPCSYDSNLLVPQRQPNLAVGWWCRPILSRRVTPPCVHRPPINAEAASIRSSFLNQRRSPLAPPPRLPRHPSPVVVDPIFRDN